MMSIHMPTNPLPASQQVALSKKPALRQACCVAVSRNDALWKEATGASDVAANFAKFIGYGGCLGARIGTAGNRELKLSGFNEFQKESMGCWLQICCRLVATNPDALRRPTEGCS